MAAIKRTELAAVLASLADKTRDQKKFAKSIAGYLVQNHQTRELDAILRNIMAVREQNGTVEANVTSAFPLSSNLQRRTTALVQQAYPAAKQVVITQTVDPEVLSGIKVQTIDKQLDETARGKLQQLTRAVA